MIAKDSRCPICRAALDAITALDRDTVPRPGDASVCIYCATVLVFDGEPLRPRLPLPSERADLYADAEIARVRQAVLVVGGKRRGLQ